MAAEKDNKYALKNTPERLKEIGEDLIDFAENDRSIHFARFCRKYKRTRQWLLDLCKQHPEFKDYYQLAKELMSAKITDLSFYDRESQVNAGFGRDNLFRYDDEWVAHMEWKAKLSQQTSEQIKTTFSEMSKAIQDGTILKLLTQIEEEKN